MGVHWPEKMADSEYRWLLEYDFDNEIITEPTTDDALIARDLARFDGQHTFYCALFDNTDEACLWCFGEPDKRFIEGRYEPGYVVLCHRGINDTSGIAVQHGMSPSDVQSVESREIMSDSDALEIFLAFFHSRIIPQRFSFNRKRYLSP